MRIAVFVVLVACARPGALPADGPDKLPPDQTRHYTIWLGGARVGTAIESEAWTRDGVRLRRDEQLRFLRGDTEVALATAIIIDADSSLVARHVRWTEAGSSVRGAEASRGEHGWQLSTGGTLAMDAVPAELVPLLVRRDGAFTGSVFLPARGFVAGSGRIEPVAPGRLVARLALDAGPVVEATIDLDRDGAPARVVDGEGVIAIRATPEQAQRPFPVVDLIAATAIQISGARRSNHLLLDGNLVVPSLPGQLARPAASGVDVELDATLGGELPAGLDSPIAPPRSARSSEPFAAGSRRTSALARRRCAMRRPRLQVTARPSRLHTRRSLRAARFRPASSPAYASTARA